MFHCSQLSEYEVPDNWTGQLNLSQYHILQSPNNTKYVEGEGEGEVSLCVSVVAVRLILKSTTTLSIRTSLMSLLQSMDQWSQVSSYGWQ